LSVGTLYYHLDGHSLPGVAVQRLPRRRDVDGDLSAMPSRARQKLAARLFRAAERQARKLEFSLAWDYQRKEDRALDLAALRELARILRDLSALEDSSRASRFASTRRERGARAGAGGGGTRGTGEQNEAGVRSSEKQRRVLHRVARRAPHPLTRPRSAGTLSLWERLLLAQRPIKLRRHQAATGSTSRSAVI
jgi:hypothetical protein